MLTTFTGIAVHDGLKPYRRYTQAQHALCNVHHLRELLGVIEPDPHDPKVVWAVRMDRLLRDLHSAVDRARAAGDDWLDPAELVAYRAAYAQIIAQGNQDDPPGTIPTGKCGVIRQTPHAICSRGCTATAQTSCASPTTSASRSTTIKPNATSG